MSSEDSADRSPRREQETISTSFLNNVRSMRPDAWARLVEVYGPIVYRWARQAGLLEHDAADVVQDVFAAVARHISRFQRDKPDQSFRGWLATITRNRIRDLHRRRSDRPQARGGTEAQLHLSNVPEADEASNSFDISALISQRALELVQAEFEPRTWQCFWRTTVDGRSPADVAEELGVSVFAVYQARSRILRRLRRQLGQLPQ